MIYSWQARRDCLDSIFTPLAHSLGTIRAFMVIACHGPSTAPGPVPFGRDASSLRSSPTAAATATSPELRRLLATVVREGDEQVLQAALELAARGRAGLGRTDRAGRAHRDPPQR
jgi:hypothetical protein